MYVDELLNLVVIIAKREHLVDEELK